MIIQSLSVVFLTYCYMQFPRVLYNNQDKSGHILQSGPFHEHFRASDKMSLDSKQLTRETKTAFSKFSPLSVLWVW